jgi:hypothetical protein
MEKFKYNFSKPKAQEEFEKLSPDEKESIISSSRDEAFDIQERAREMPEQSFSPTWKRRLDFDKAAGEKNYDGLIEDLLTDSQVVELVDSINNRQPGIEAEIIDKVQDIYQNHFAIHGASIEKLPTILQDGILSREMSDKYENKNLNYRRPLKYTSTHDASIEEQGYGRVSSFSTYNLLKSFNDIDADTFKTDIIHYSAKHGINAENYVISSNEIRTKLSKNWTSVSTEYELNHKELKTDIKKIQDEIFKKIIENLQNEIPGVDVRNFRIRKSEEIHPSKSWEKYDELHFTIQIDKEIEEPKEAYMKNFFRHFLEILAYYSRSGKENYFSNLLSETVRELNIPLVPREYNAFGDLLKDIELNILEKAYEKLNKVEIKQQFLKAQYKHSWSDFVNVIIDVDRIDDVSMNKSIVFKWLDGERLWPNKNMQHKSEAPITGRVKKNAICGLELVNERPQDIKKTAACIDLLIDIIDKINIDHASRYLSEDDLQIIETVKSGFKINIKDVLVFASKLCNYNFFKKDFDGIDILYAMANYHKLPVYDKDGNVLWPKNIQHKDVANE